MLISQEVRSSLTKAERERRSRLAQLIRSRGVLRGSLVEMNRTCGNPRCRCAKGYKHVSLYLSYYHNGKQRLIYVPKTWEPRVQSWVATYQQVRTLLDEIVQDCVHRLKQRKE